MGAPLLMSVPEAAAYLGRSQWWVRERIAEGELPARRVGARFFVPRPGLDAWLQGQAPEMVRPSLGTPSPKGSRRVA